MYCLDLCRKGFQASISIIKMVTCLRNIPMTEMFTIKSIDPDNMSHFITKKGFAILIMGLGMEEWIVGYSSVTSVIRASL